jgi:hypothetical protein
MRDALEQRRTELAAELESGQRMLADLDARRVELQQTLLRISGALQVVTELLDADSTAGDDHGEAAEFGVADLVPAPAVRQAG